jgi:uncharacterized metal-binding protein
MHADFPVFEELYADGEHHRLAHASALVEAEGYGEWTRLQETAELARRMGFDRIGITHCPDMVREAAIAASYLRDYGLQVHRPESRSEPFEQARELENRQTQMNVVAGMCVPHEAIFVRASRAPVSVLVARDVRFQHNPAAALYTGGLDRLRQVARGSSCGRSERRCRVGEAMDFAHQLGAAHLGLSFCTGLRREAEILTRVLRANGFRVSSAICKTGAVPKETLGLQDHQKVHPGRPEMACNSLAQAELLNRAGVELAFVLGQCVGHDAATLARLAAPAVCLVAKDRVLAHNTVAALYERI